MHQNIAKHPVSFPWLPLHTRHDADILNRTMRTTAAATTTTKALLTPATMRVRLAGVRPASIIQAQARQYTCTPIRSYPTAIARAERAADLKKHPESALTQEKLDDKKGNRHWSEENATLSEADVSLLFVVVIAG
jgi:hypothetical protein